MGKLPGGGRAALLCLHSHGDRSFLDDRELALLSGELSAAGQPNDLVVAVLTGPEVEARLAETLRAYAVVVYERVFSRELLLRLREALPGIPFVACDGEHALADPPAELVCGRDLHRDLPAILAHLRGEGALPPGTLVREGGRLVPASPVAPPPPLMPGFAPNLRPVVVNPEALPARRSFSLTGNPGCPYQADARDNPLYAGVALPEGTGRGCAFCVTGNQYQGSPPHETAARVLSQLRYLRAHAPELTELVLKDQNPFAWLTELVESCAAERLGGFTLLLETRADWLLRSEARFERALDAAGGAGIQLAPFLVGIESFSQAELDRFNKGTTAAANEAFLLRLAAWEQSHPRAFTLAHASFGFLLFTPWTTFEDLRQNLAAIRRTGLTRLRGSLLLSRARLYPDTALHWLAARDGLLAQSYGSPAENASQRYGYYPAVPWRFAEPRVASLAALATEATERTGGRDQDRLLEVLLAAFDEAGSRAVTLAEVLLRLHGAKAPPELTRRLGPILSPLPLDGPFAGGWRIAEATTAPGEVWLRLWHPVEPELELRIVPRGERPGLSRSRHYDLVAAGASVAKDHPAAVAVGAALVANDR